MKLVSMLLHAEQPAGERIAIVDGERSYTRPQAVAAVAQCVERLREQGLDRGHRVLAVLDHDADGVFLMAAASALGLRVLVPYNLTEATCAEWRNLAINARPDFVVYARRDPAGLAGLVESHPRVVHFRCDDIATGPQCGADALVRMNGIEATENFLVLFTSGSTGSPKAISISEALVCQRVVSVSARLKFGSGARIFMSGLLNNTTGVIFSFGALLHEATLIFPRGRDVAAWPAQVAGRGATHIMLRPVSMKVFLEAAAAGRVDLSCLRMVAYGAAALPSAVLEEGRRMIPCEWTQGYGLSETYGPFCWLDEAAHRERRYQRDTYCVGRPDDTLEVDLAPLTGHRPGVGEVVLRGKALMDGYYDVATAAVRPPAEWLRTGDVGAWSPDGDLLLKGRISDSLMSANGHRIYPAEVEAVLAAVPDVDEVVLVSMAEPGTPTGRPLACVAGPLASREPSAIRDTIACALAQALSREKWPDLIYASETAFPKGGNDKVLRATVLRQIDRNRIIEL